MRDESTLKTGYDEAIYKIPVQTVRSKRIGNTPETIGTADTAFGSSNKALIGTTMPLTALDSNSALIVIDLQKGIMEMPVVHPIKDIVEQSARLARAFRKRGLPVVLARITGGAPGRTDVVRPQVSRPPDWAEIVPEMEWQPNDHVVTRQRVGAFLGTDLNPYLRGRGVTQVFLTGVATSAGVEATARSAYDLGYNVVLVMDAMTDRDAETHRHSAEKTFPRLGETTTTNEVLGLLGAT